MKLQLAAPLVELELHLMALILSVPFLPYFMTPTATASPNLRSGHGCGSPPDLRWKRSPPGSASGFSRGFPYHIPAVEDCDIQKSHHLMNPWLEITPLNEPMVETISRLLVITGESSFQG